MPAVSYENFPMFLYAYNENKILSIPVRGRIKENRWVLNKIILDVIKNNTQWFWCQTISMHQSFLY